MYAYESLARAGVEKKRAEVLPKFIGPGGEMCRA